MAAGTNRKSFKAMDASFNEFPDGGICETCGRGYRSKCALLKHIRIKHDQQKLAFSCDDCNKRFSDRQQLNAHLEKHDKCQRFKCDTCSETFTYRHNLTRHMKKHPTPKVHTCSYCSQEFGRGDTLLQHIRVVHDQAAKYTCNICGGCYRWKFSLRRHMKNKH
ncbi:gastrula zinc finger protein XlCGF8.2DB-like [Saccostrea cucullata]|uniref:gastrula zinc finger protein XlCGF8.2DB-like n=1 Tax=Saccostrea cuccullata TaxID=36930 RepID=UPI002ED52909